MNPRGKTALVTGASRGIGAATAQELAKAGARVILVARREEQLRRVAASIGNAASVYPTDLSDEKAVTAVPYFAAFYVTHAFLPGMLRRNSGHIVNVSSVGSRFVWPGATAYLAARWAVRGFTEALRSDLAKTGIRVTLYESGVVRSEYWEHNPGSRERVPKMGNLVPALSSEAAARAIVRGIEREKKLVVVPFMMKLTYWQHAVFPSVVQSLMTRTGYKKRSSELVGR